VRLLCRAAAAEALVARGHRPGPAGKDLPGSGDAHRVQLALLLMSAPVCGVPAHPSSLISSDIPTGMPPLLLQYVMEVACGHLVLRGAPICYFSSWNHKPITSLWHDTLLKTTLYPGSRVNLPGSWVSVQASEDALALLARMVALDPGRRIRAEEALQHPYFRSEPMPTPPGQLPRPPVRAHNPLNLPAKVRASTDSHCLLPSLPWRTSCWPRTGCGAWPACMA
jgi:serine/threonine protein kinase